MISLFNPVKKITSEKGVLFRNSHKRRNKLYEEPQARSLRSPRTSQFQQTTHNPENNLTYNAHCFPFTPPSRTAPTHRSDCSDTDRRPFHTPPSRTTTHHAMPLPPPSYPLQNTSNKSSTREVHIPAPHSDLSSPASTIAGCQYVPIPSRFCCF